MRIQQDAEPENLEQRQPEFLLLAALLFAVLPPHRRLLDELADIEHDQGGQDADP